MGKLTLTQRLELIKDFFFHTIERRGQIVELRLPKAEGGPLSGLFNDPDALARAAAAYSGKVPGVYVGLNPVKPSLVSRVKNRLAKVSSAVRDTDIQRRRWLPIDFDPVRPANTSSTNAEHKAAIALAKKCRDWLCNEGWPEPLLGDSGNGAHLLYCIDLPNGPGSRKLVHDCLEALSLRFSNSTIQIDTGNSNASRIWRVYGTLNCKGEASEERPYRRARILDAPDEMKFVSREQLSKLASALPVSEKDTRGEQSDVARWLRENKVPVVADAPWKGGGHKWILQCPWDESHTNNSAFILRFPDGGIAAGCLHKSCAGKNWPALRAYFEQRSGGATQPESTPQDKLPGGKKETQTKVLLELASELELFCTPQGEAYVTFPVKNHYETYLVKSRAFDQFLRFNYFSVTKTAPRPQAIHEAVAHFGALAMFDSPRHPIFVRVAAAGERNYLDLADDQWRAIAFDADGWRVVKNPVVKFRRTPGMLPLPTPIRGGNINELRKFLNLRSDGDWILFVSDLLQALLSCGPYPVLGLHGEAGCGKTTSSRIFKAMVDPSTSPARAMPKDIRDLMIMASNSYVLVFDNLSYLPPWFSDCLCRLSTGGSLTTRQLYTDSDEVLFEGQRPLVLNGIEELASRTDLVDRSLIIDLPVIERFTQEREFWQRFEEAHPRLLGALLDVVVEALRKLPEVRIKSNRRRGQCTVQVLSAKAPCDALSA